MGSIGAIHGVDDTLKTIAKTAVGVLNPKPKVTVGPLDSSGPDARVNWFLYRIDPHPAYRNMEPPQSGWRTARGQPPLALQLHYLLTAFPSGSGGTDGDQEQFSHGALAAVMQALAANPVLGESDPALSAQAKPLVEPLRITMDALDLEALSKLWTAASQPMRLSVGYQVSLVTIDALARHAAGPPVRERRVAVAPTLGPRLVDVTPQRASAGIQVALTGEGLLSSTAYRLAREADDPAATGDWPLTVVSSTGDTVTLAIPRADLAPGLRRLDVVVTENGLQVGRDSIGLTLVPTITGTTPVATAAAGATVHLAVEHAARDLEVVLRGKVLPAANVTFVSATQVDVKIPAGAAAGPAPLALRANKTAGPTHEGLAVS
jgi:hypothetical protein